MRTSLLSLLLALGLSATATAQAAMLAATSPQATSTTLPDPGERPEARTLISQVMEAELQTPKLQKYGARLVFIDVKTNTATARVEYDKTRPTKSVLYLLRQQPDGQWTITGRTSTTPVQL